MPCGPRLLPDKAPRESTSTRLIDPRDKYILSFIDTLRRDGFTDQQIAEFIRIGRDMYCTSALDTINPMTLMQNKGLMRVPPGGQQ
jgi:hypothetical protein